MRELYIIYRKIIRKDFPGNKTMGNIKKFGLMGGQLGHSLSKPIHMKLLELKGIEGSYEYFETADAGKCFAEELNELSGFNVTIPYKKEIIEYIDYPDENVRLYNACNTVSRKEDGWYGYNTDVDGFLYTMEVNGVSLCGSRVLVTGAGGVSHMLATESARRGAEVVLLSRNEEKGIALSDFVKEKTGREVKLYSGEDKFDILLQGTPAGMYPSFYGSAVELELVRNIGFVFDMIYNPEKTLVMKVAELFGNKSASGLSMLVCQAAKAQEKFLGVSFTRQEIRLVENYIRSFLKPAVLDFNVILTGMPGCGKSSAGKKLAFLLGAEFVDSDDEIEKETGMKIPEIFEKYGEDYFRKAESDIIKKLLAQRGRVISTGGGLPVYNNIKELKREGDITVYMETPFEILAKRLENDISRPLLSENAVEKLAKLEKERVPVYESSADIIVGFCDGIREYAVKICREIIKKREMK